MSLSVNELTSITHRFIMPKMFDNIFNANPALQRIMKSGQYKSQDGGTTIDIPLNYADTDASGWYQGSDTLDTSGEEQLTAAVYQWRSAYAAITITEEDELKNSGKAAAVSLLASKSQIAEKTIKKILSEGLYSDGTTAKSIVGLRDIVATDQVVGSIDQSANSWWQAQIDSSTTTMTLSALNQVYEDASEGDEQPTMALATKANYNRFYNLLQPQQRFMDSEVAKAGFTSLMFNGIPFIKDTNCPTNHVFFINESQLWMIYHPERNISLQPFQKPINQEVKTARILWMGSLASSNNRFHGALTALTA